MSKIANGDMRQRVKKTFIDCRPDHSEVEWSLLQPRQLAFCHTYTHRAQ